MSQYQSDFHTTMHLPSNNSSQTPLLTTPTPTRHSPTPSTHSSPSPLHDAPSTGSSVSLPPRSGTPYPFKRASEQHFQDLRNASPVPPLPSPQISAVNVAVNVPLPLSRPSTPARAATPFRYDGRRTPCRTYLAPVVQWVSYRPVSMALSEDQDEEEEDSAASHVPSISRISKPRGGVPVPFSALPTARHGDDDVVRAIDVDTEVKEEEQKDVEGRSASARTLSMQRTIDALPLLTRYPAPSSVRSLPLRAPLPPSPAPVPSPCPAQTQAQTPAPLPTPVRLAHRAPRSRSRSRFTEHLSLNGEALYANSLASKSVVFVSPDGTVREVPQDDGRTSGEMGGGSGSGETVDEEKVDDDAENVDDDAENVDDDEEKDAVRQRGKGWRARWKKGVLRVVCCGEKSG